MVAPKRRQLVVNNQLVSFIEYTLEENPKENILMLHGWMSEASLWNGLAQSLAEEGYRVVAPDLPGFGQSENPQRNFSVDDYVDLTLTLVERLGFNAFVLVGHSFGGRIGIKIAHRKIESLKKLILIGAAGIKLNEKRTQKISSLASLGKSLLPEFLYKKIKGSVYKAIGSNEALLIPELEGTFKKVVGEDLEPFLKDIEVSTLLIWGENDDATPLEAGLIMDQKIPSSSIIVIPGAGHYVFLDNTKRVADEVLSFLR